MTVTFGEQRTEEQKAYDAEVLERVKRGMALLERAYGINWVDYIDLDTLELRDGNACVLGQVYGSYTRGVDTLWPRPALSYAVIDHGFVARNDPEWDALNAAWQDALTPIVTKT